MFNIRKPDHAAVEVKPREEVRFEVDDIFYAVRLLSQIEAERLDYLKLKMDIEEAKAKNIKKWNHLKTNSGSFPYTENCR